MTQGGDGDGGRGTGGDRGDRGDRSGQAENTIDYETLAATYARYRAASPHVLGYLQDVAKPYGHGARLLDVGCGTGDFVAALGEALAPAGAVVCGFDRSEAMIGEARRKHPDVPLSRGEAEQTWPFAASSFDVVYSVNVIHYLRDLELVAYFGEAQRVLRPGGTIVTVTDSEEDIANRTMTKYFPETVPHEQARYHPVSRLQAAMRTVGFLEQRVGHTRREGVMQTADLDSYRNRIFSSLRLISDEEFARGLARLKADYAAGRRDLVELYTYVCGVKSAL